MYILRVSIVALVFFVFHFLTYFVYYLYCWSYLMVFFNFGGCGAAPMPIYSVIVYREQLIVLGFTGQFYISVRASYTIKSSKHDMTEICLKVMIT
jgi:hypothetical protein